VGEVLEWTPDPEKESELERARAGLRDLLLSVATAALPQTAPAIQSDVGPSPVDPLRRPGVSRCHINVGARADRPADPSLTVERARTVLAAAGWGADEPRSLGSRLTFAARRNAGHTMECYAEPGGVELYGSTPEFLIAQARHVRPEPVRTAEAVHPGSVLCYECQGLGWCDVCEGDGWIDARRCPLCMGEKLCPICRGAGELAVSSLSPFQRDHYPQLRST
jgi:hypothetical protein